MSSGVPVLASHEPTAERGCIRGCVAHGTMFLLRAISMAAVLRATRPTTLGRTHHRPAKPGKKPIGLFYFELMREPGRIKVRQITKIDKIGQGYSTKARHTSYNDASLCGNNLRLIG